MSKVFKVGDVVTVRNDLIEGKIYGSDYFVFGMHPFLGNKVTIKNVVDCGTYMKYHIKECGWNWSAEMFVEGIENTSKTSETISSPVSSITTGTKPIIKDFVYAKMYQNFTETDLETGKVTKGTFTIPERHSRIIHSQNATVCILDDGTKGVAKCDPQDTYDRIKGIKIAYNRAKIKLLQKELKKLTGKSK